MSLNNEAENVEPTEPDGLMASVAGEPEQQASDEEMPHRAEDEQPAKEERPEWLDAKFATAEDLAKSYDELQKKFSQGKHKAPDEYSTDVLTDAGYQMDDPIVDTYMGWAKKYGVNQEAFDELAGAITSMSGEREQQVEFDLKAEREALGPNADAIIKSNVQWADGLMRKGVVSDAERNEINIWGGSAVGQRLMQKVRQMSGDMSKIPVAPVAEESMSQADFEADISSKMADKRYGNDPAFTRSVEKMFETRFN